MNNLERRSTQAIRWESAVLFLLVQGMTLALLGSCAHRTEVAREDRNAIPIILQIMTDLLFEAMTRGKGYFHP